MKEELLKIGKQLKKWSEKYNIDYVDMSIMDDVIFANINPEDERYEKCRIFGED